MYKFIGFDVDHKHTTACIVQPGRPDRYARLKTQVGDLRDWLKAQRQPGDWLEPTSEISGLAGHLYDGLVDAVDRLEVSNPAKLTWIYRTATKTDRIEGGDKQRRKIALVATAHYLVRVMQAMLRTGEGWRYDDRVAKAA